MIIIPTEIRSGQYGILLNFRHGLNLNFLESTRWGLFWRKTWWEGTLDPTHPLMWQAKNGTLYMPYKYQRRTDLGSIPPPIQSLFPATEMPFAYYPHDIGYSYGGMWTSPSLEGPWSFLRMPRAEIDEMWLLHVPEAAGVPLVRRNLIYRTVRAAGWACWDPKGRIPDEKTNQPR